MPQHCASRVVTLLLAIIWLVLFGCYSFGFHSDFSRDSNSKEVCTAMVLCLLKFAMEVKN